MGGENVVNSAFVGTTFSIFKYGTLLVENRYGFICQTFKYNGYVACRLSTNEGSTWSELEWNNPPMALGTEYRTTERHEGKPVYTKFVNFGALPNASTGYLNNALPINAYAFSIEGFVNTSAGYAHRLDPLVDNLWSATGYGYIGITTSKDMSGYDAYLKLKYTKE